MFIYWGRRVYRKKQGIAADFCGICRRPSIVDIVEIRSQAHIYGISLGQGDVVGRLCQCKNCTSQWTLLAGTVQHPVAATAAASLESLLEMTFPRFSKVYDERLEQETAILRDPFSLSHTVRFGFMAEPFFILDNDFAENRKRNSVGKFFSLLATAFAIFSGIFALGSFESGPLPAVFFTILTIGFAIAANRILVADMNRYLRKSIYPRLASCLSPLRPSPEELEFVVKSIKSNSASRIRLPEVLAMMQDARTPIPVAQNVGDR